MGKESRIWQAFALAVEEKCTPTIFMTFWRWEDKQFLNMEIWALTAENLAKNLLDELGKIYLEDESSQAYEAYDLFEKVK